MPTVPMLAKPTTGQPWLAADAEPGAWDVSGTTTRTAAGYLGFWAGCDAAAASQIAMFDDITITTA